MILALASAALLQVQGMPAPSNVQDDEIAWITGAENRFWQEVSIEASASSLVQDLLEKKGFRFVCRGMQGMRERLVASHFAPYREAVVRSMREQIPLGTLYTAVEAGPQSARSIIGDAAFDRAFNAPDVQKRLSVRAASYDMQARMRNNYAMFGGPEKPFDRPRPETMARVRAHPDMLPFWCNLSDDQRARTFGGFLEVNQ